VPESSDQELIRLREETERQRTTIAESNFTIAKLTTAITELQEQLKQALEGNSELRALLSELQAKLDKLLAQKKKRDRKDHGPTTERHNPKPATAGATVEELSSKPRKQPAERNHKKHIHSQNIPTRPVPHKVAKNDLLCPTCQIETVFVKNEITYQLEKILHSLERLEHRQEVRACPKCKKHVVMAEKPCQPIPGGLPGPCLLASTIVEKCDDGLPQYRQSKIAKREDATLPRSTLCDWFQNGAFTLELLYERLKREVLTSQVVQTDDCPVKIQNRKAKGAMRKGKMTVYRGDAEHPAVVFDFSPDLSFQRNNDFLKDFSGFVQADAAAGFDALFKDGTKTEVGCSAHSRRKYFELCNDVIEIYGKLYDIERQIKGQTAAHILAIRRRRSKPLTKQLHRKLTELRGTLHPTHPLMEAIEYTLRHWVALHRFLGNPNLEIDNNPAERAIKDFVIARKNFLFVGSDAGGKAMAINLSFIASCKRNEINPVAYLADVFSRINTMKTSELDQLLPHRWHMNRKDHQIQTLSQPP